MALQDGFKLTLPDGTEFEATKEVTKTYEQDVRFIFSGLSTPLAILERLRGDDADSLKKQLAIGAGAGTRIQTFEFEKQEKDPGDSETWGSANPDDSARTKMDIFENALDTTALTSSTAVGDGPAKLATGEFNPNGQFPELQVVLSTLRLERRPEDTSTFGGTVEFLTTESLDEVIHGENRTG